MTDAEVTILVVDDDTIETMAVRRSFKTLRMDNPIVEAGDGIEALQHLRGEGGHSKLQPPFMVLLDLNMPRMGGIEFLEQVRGDPALESALIFVMTTSLAENDRAGAYAQHVAGYILKQRPGQSFLDAIRMLSQYCKVVEFPVCT